MALRQSAAPIQFDMTRRMDNVSVLTTTKAGVSCPVTVAPLLAGDSCTGRVQFDLQLAEMPRPLNNAVLARAQAWCVPRPALPYFMGEEDYVRAYQGKAATRLGGASVAASALFSTANASTIDLTSGHIFYHLGIVHENNTTQVSRDYIDAYNLIWNFRRDAHSSKIPRANYASENVDSQDLKQAFWPTNRMMQVVPDYESALVVGSLELDVSAGQVPVSGIYATQGTLSPARNTNLSYYDAAGNVISAGGSNMFSTADGMFVSAETSGAPSASNIPQIFAEMAGQTITTTLADIDKARTTNAFAKMRAMMAGSDFSGFNTDDVIVSQFMQGFTVPDGLLNRPMLLDSKTVVFGMVERHATDSANLDDSVSTAQASVSLSINVPKMQYGAIIMTTIEVMPERLYERQQDPYLYCTTVDDLPNALADVQRVEPVDIVLNSRVDTRHSTPSGIFGYEPMNAKWRREFTRLGGEFIQTTPGVPNQAQRTAIWQPDIVDPALTSDHWLCPSPFPQDVFSVPANDVCEIAARQMLTITGITQFGDMLVEDNDEFLDTKAEQV